MRATRRRLLLLTAVIAAALVALHPVGTAPEHGNGTVQWAGLAAAPGSQHAVRVHGTD